MFDAAPGGGNTLNPDCRIYREIAKIATVMRTTAPLRFGRMYFRPISTDGVHFGLPYGFDYTLAFSRLLRREEVLVAYNVSATARSDAVVVDASLHRKGDKMSFLYGGPDDVEVESTPDGLTRFVRLDLSPHQFAIVR